MFQPAIPLGGVAGWQFLGRTESAQRAAFDKSAVMAREVAYFEENIFKITSAEELVADRQLLKVALGAFGLDEELPKKAFIEKILAEGTDDPESLANKFVDPRYAELSRAFGFGNLGGARTFETGFAQRITSAYRERQFEVAVGGQNEDMRLALTFRRQMSEYAAQDSAVDTKWLRVLGNRPVRAVVEAALGLPAQFSGLDVDKQLETLKDRASSILGSSDPAMFTDPGKIEEVINRFLVRRQIDAGPTAGTPGFAALSLLQNARGSLGVTNLILSNLR